jgi:excinuclease ABC subunit B
VGINLLREGLDMPEVSLVAILDADQEGFLRSDRSLIQTVGRAARHVEGRAIFYADRITDSMKRCIEETTRRRETQVAHNLANGIVPKGVRKSVEEVRFITRVADARDDGDEKGAAERAPREAETRTGVTVDLATLPQRIEQLELEMRTAAKELDFETAARLRDELFELRLVADGKKPTASRAAAAAAAGGEPMTKPPRSTARGRGKRGPR